MDLPPPYTARETQDHSSHQLSAALVSSPPLFETRLHQNHSEDLEAAVSVSPPPYDRVNTEGASGSNITTSHGPLEVINLESMNRDAALCHLKLEESLRQLLSAGIELTPEWTKNNRGRNKERLRSFVLYILERFYGINPTTLLSDAVLYHFSKIATLWTLYRTYSNSHARSGLNSDLRTQIRSVLQKLVFEPAESLGLPIYDNIFWLFQSAQDEAMSRIVGEEFRVMKSEVLKHRSLHRLKLLWDITMAHAVLTMESWEAWRVLSTAIRKEGSVNFPGEMFNPVFPGAWETLCCPPGEKYIRLDVQASDEEKS
jgi:hypothetical protein